MINYSNRNIEYIHTLGARRVVGYALAELCNCHSNLTAVYADVGSRFEIPQRLNAANCLEIGIAEQSLISILGGLYHEGMLPFGVAYAPFITMRAADQIRMTVGEMGLGIKLIGGSAGLVSANLGSASMGLDDIAMMRAIPNMNIVCPSDCLQMVKAIEYAAQNDISVYIRLTGGNEVKPVYRKNIEFQLGKATVVYENGRDVVMYGCGMQVISMIEAAKLLEEAGIRTSVIDMHTIKPLDTQMIRRYSGCTLAVTAEEHNIIGGLGSAVSEYLTQISGQPLLRLGIGDCYPEPDTYESLLEQNGLTSHGIASAVQKRIAKI